MRPALAAASLRARNRLAAVRKSEAPLLAGTALCLFISSAGLFRRFAGEPGVIGYALAVAAGVVLAWRAAPRLHRRLTERQALAIAALAFVALGVIFAVGYPLANSGQPGEGSDRDEALDIAASRLLAGQYPYHARTYLDNPISPMPGSLLLAAPFVVLGRSAYQNLAWLLVFLVIARDPRRGLDNRYTLFMFLSLLVLAPVVLYELITGSDLLANALFVLTALLLLVRASPREAAVRVGLKAAFFGIALSSRPNFLLLAPVVLAALVRRWGWPKALRYSGISLAAFAAVTLPFWLYDPAGFSPLHAVNKLRLFNVILPRSEIIIPLLAAGLAVGLAVRRPANPSVLLRDCAAVQALPVMLGVLLPVVLTGRLYLSYGLRFGDNFLFFAVLYFWQRLSAHTIASNPGPPPAHLTTYPSPIDTGSIRD